MALGKDKPRSASETCFRASSPKIYRCGKYSYGSSDCNHEQEQFDGVGLLVSSHAAS
jgi:hypothetical protein